MSASRLRVILMRHMTTMPTWIVRIWHGRAPSA